MLDVEGSESSEQVLTDSAPVPLRPRAWCFGPREVSGFKSGERRFPSSPRWRTLFAQAEPFDEGTACLVEAAKIGIPHGCFVECPVHMEAINRPHQSLHAVAVAATQRLIPMTTIALAAGDTGLLKWRILNYPLL